MAAQERAKQAQLKQASQPVNSVSEPTSVQAEKEKMMKALGGVTEEPKVVVEKVEKKPIAPPPPPPPSFDIFEKQMQQLQQKQPAVETVKPAQLAPPAFDDIAMDMFQQEGSVPSAPSAPPVEFSAPPPDLMTDEWNGIMPMAPPPVEATEPVVPSFDQAMLDQTAGAYDFDMDGNALSEEEKRKMVEDQRAIMEQIMKDASNNKASEAAVRADAFQSRMAASQEATGVAGFSANEVEEQRKILEAIEKSKNQQQQVSTSQSDTSTVEIGGGHKVALHGQEKTQQAIKDGTASTVMCLNCGNWMRVAETATLMFCPICSVVSPVVKQDEIMSEQEIMQMEEDRKLAEQLQMEENQADVASDYPGNRHRTTAAAATAAGDEKGWWDTIADALGVGETETDGKRSSEVAVSRPPGSLSSSQGMLHSATTGDEGTERVGLLNDADDYGPPAARVAEAKPLFSCVVDSISNTASAISTGIMGEEEEVHGVDTTSFLSVPNVGRDRGNNPSGSYHAIPENG
eukprot:CAMPEP_0197237172 /NCGR_PEP_ID=MMETSP1429-20130617/4086_1 /TAXON_ID=49237 /ORGANISM="Chaetoceros  sp., Strain UNC1202" /LENGTH=515 /DNA_ID=CAMNT_0042696133 /DNA_START=29 /DNA_END=1576 /DNA_ORIENTATION=+